MRKKRRLCLRGPNSSSMLYRTGQTYYWVYVFIVHECFIHKLFTQ